MRFFVPVIVDPIEVNLTSSPLLKLWFGKYIAFAGIDLLIGRLPANPTTTLVVVVPIPTDLVASK